MVKSCQVAVPADEYKSSPDQDRFQYLQVYILVRSGGWPVPNIHGQI